MYNHLYNIVRVSNLNINTNIFSTFVKFSWYSNTVVPIWTIIPLNSAINRFFNLKLSTNSKLDLLQGLMKSQWKLFWNIVIYLQTAENGGFHVMV